MAKGDGSIAQLLGYHYLWAWAARLVATEDQIAAVSSAAGWPCSIAAAQQRIIDSGLEIATRIFEVTGARASSNSVGPDIFWRNPRTYSLHDPVAYKRVEVGRYALSGTLPEPTWYT